MSSLQKIVAPLLYWYSLNKRDLAWRVDIHPYKTWVSEIMLQQTRVEAVKEYFARFMKRLPTIFDLARIEEDELLKLWEGLGYYNRVRNMQKMAKIVVEKYDGEIPDNYDELIQLPGIGDYTAGAILSIAYQQKIPCVDGNVLRVITRVLGSYEDIGNNKTKTHVKELLQEILPADVGDFNQALMELGALICLPNGEPLCDTCPLRDFCVAHQNNLTEEIPVKTKKITRKQEDYTVFLITCQGKIMLEKRDDKGLLASLYQLPNRPGILSEEQVIQEITKMGLTVHTLKKCSNQKHIFSHVEWNMVLYKVEVERENNGLFVSEEERIQNYPLPTAFEKLLK